MNLATANSRSKKYSIAIINFIIFFSSCLPDDNLIPDTNDDRDKIAYRWLCEENSPSFGELYYYVDIEKDSVSENKVLLYNFYGLADESFLRASISGMKLTIINEIIEGHVVSGEGAISANYKTIDWTYEVTELKKSTIEEKFSELVTATYNR